MGPLFESIVFAGGERFKGDLHLSFRITRFKTQPTETETNSQSITTVKQKQTLSFLF